MPLERTAAERAWREAIPSPADNPLPDNPVDQGQTGVIPYEVECPLPLLETYRDPPAPSAPHVEAKKVIALQDVGAIVGRVPYVGINVDGFGAAHFTVELADKGLYVLLPAVTGRVVKDVVGAAYYSALRRKSRRCQRVMLPWIPSRGAHGEAFIHDFMRHT